MKRPYPLIPLLMISNPAISSDFAVDRLDLTQSWVGIVALIVLVVAYTLVILQEKIQLRKSRPMLLAAPPCVARFELSLAVLVHRYLVVLYIADRRQHDDGADHAVRGADWQT